MLLGGLGIERVVLGAGFAKEADQFGLEFFGGGEEFRPGCVASATSRAFSSSLRASAIS